MIGYWITIILLFVFFVLYFLANKKLIFKNSKIGEILKSEILKFVIKRILNYLLILFVIINIVFILTYLMPKEYLLNYVGAPTKDSLNDNFLKQLFDYYFNILPFPKKICTSYYLEEESINCSCYKYKIINLGISYTYMTNVDVTSIILEKCSVSFIVGILAYIIQIAIGYPLGVFLAKREDNLANKFFNTVHHSISVTPAIAYFYMFTIIFMLFFKLPISFQINDIKSYIAPVSAIGLTSSLAVAYWVRRYISIEMNKDYVKLAISKGLDEKTIFNKHIMKNALIPLIRTIPTSIISCLCGFYLLEVAFNIPGIGSTLSSAITLQDIYLIQGLIIFFSFLSIISYILGDLITILLDHRTTLAKGGKEDEK